MSVLRQGHFIGQQRVDIPHLRALESGVCADFDLLAGQMLAGRQPLVVTGFELIKVLQVPATTLQMAVAEGALIHFYASESGSIFRVPADAPVETLSTTNTKIRGSFTPGLVNFVGIDLIRRVDEETKDLVMFLDADTLLERSKDVPIARTLDYVIVISTTEFSATPGIVPVAKVKTTANNFVESIEDARSMWFRLGSGGSNPDKNHSYAWPQGRVEVGSDLFVGGDKSIESLKEWMDAIMTRLWELSGGPFWYSPATPYNMKLVRGGNPYVENGEHIMWDDGTSTATWKGLKFVFENSPGFYNDIADGTSTLQDGDCLYVDIDRNQNRSGSTALVMQSASLSTLGVAPMPGNRVVVCWRVGSELFSRDNQFPVNGGTFKPATTISLGAVRLSGTPIDGSNPDVPVVTPDLEVVASGVTRLGLDSGFGPIRIGHITASDEYVQIGAPTVFASHRIQASGTSEPSLSIDKYFSDRADFPNEKILQLRSTEQGDSIVVPVLNVLAGGIVEMLPVHENVNDFGVSGGAFETLNQGMCAFMFRKVPWPLPDGQHFKVIQFVILIQKSPTDIEPIVLAQSAPFQE